MSVTLALIHGFSWRVASAALTRVLPKGFADAPRASSYRQHDATGAIRYKKSLCPLRWRQLNGMALASAARSGVVPPTRPKIGKMNSYLSRMPLR
jgi:hypothetical protein